MAKQARKFAVLLVDDEPHCRESMAMVLRSAGYEVSTAENGIDALTQLNRCMPDLLISDINMPEMSGLELLPMVRHSFPNIPLIAISGAYDSLGNLPDGITANALYAKGRSRPEELLRYAAELLHTSGMCAGRSFRLPRFGAVRPN